MSSDQKLTTEVEVTGAEKGAKSIDKVVETQKRLTESTEGLAKATDLLAGSTGDLAESSKKLSSQRTANRVEGYTRKVGALASVVVKVAVALGMVRNVLRRFPAMLALEVGIIRTISLLKQEVAERLRLIDVMRTQGRVHEELEMTRRRQRATMEDIAYRRGFGGFDPDTSRRVQGQAENARKEFNQLGEGSVNQAMGMFGGIGLAQRDLTDLAIGAQLGMLDKAHPARLRTEDRARRLSARLLQRIRGSAGFKSYVRTESIQGHGRGRAAFRPDVTEQDVDAAAQVKTPYGDKEALRRELEERLPEGADVEKTVRFLEHFGSAAEIEAAIQGVVSRWVVRPCSANS